MNKGHNFCPTANHAGGSCCEANKTCTRSTVCSSDIEQANSTLKFWACSNSPRCRKAGTSHIVTAPLNSSSVVTLTPFGDVVDDNLCNYLIQFPPNSKVGDKVYFRVNVITRGSVYYAIGNEYSDLMLAQGTAAKSVRYELSYPNRAYITVLARDNLRVEFNIYVWGFTNSTVTPNNNNTNNSS